MWKWAEFSCWEEQQRKEGRQAERRRVTAQALHQYRFGNEFLVIANNAYSDEGAKGAAGKERHGTEKGEDSWWNCEYCCRNDKFHNSHIWLMGHQESIPCSFGLNRSSSASGRFIICLSLLLLSIYDFKGICIECFYRKAFCFVGGRGRRRRNYVRQILNSFSAFWGENGVGIYNLFLSWSNNKTA